MAKIVCAPGCTCGRHSRRKCADGCTCPRHPVGRPFHRADDYFGNHRLVRAARGRAVEHQCVTCCAPAAHWASVHGEDGTDVYRHYMPMCISCHHAYDESHERAGFHGRKHSEETKAKISAASKGRAVSLEQREKISNALIGIKRTEEQNENNRQARLGKKLTLEHRAKIGEASRGRPSPNKGKTLSVETRAKMSEAAKARWARLRDET